VLPTPGASFLSAAAERLDIRCSRQAISYLEKFLDLSKNANPSNHARACCSLGVIYSKQRKYDKAVKYFDKFFEVRIPRSLLSSRGMLYPSVYTHASSGTSSLDRKP